MKSKCQLRKIKLHTEVRNLLGKAFTLLVSEIENNVIFVTTVSHKNKHHSIKIGTTYLYLSALKNFRLLITIFAAIFMA